MLSYLLRRPVIMVKLSYTVTSTCSCISQGEHGLSSDPCCTLALYLIDKKIYAYHCIILWLTQQQNISCLNYWSYSAIYGIAGL